MVKRDTPKMQKKSNFKKRKNRRVVTLLRIIRYGINNFSRNAWLSIAATLIMTITLLVVFISVSARNVLVDSVGQIRDKVDMSIYLKTDTTDEQATEVQNLVEGLESVKRVTYISPAAARIDFIEKNSESQQVIEALAEATNQFPGILRINIVDINDPSELDDFVQHNEVLAQYIDEERPPSFSGERREAIQKIASWVSAAEKVGIVASILFVAISSLIVFNTIRMAIFNRKEEIQMMKLIGAERNFIRGPFIVEAVFYGFIAAIFATALGIGILYSTQQPLLNYDIAIGPTIEFMQVYAWAVVLGMIVIGAFIGVISSLLATVKYLKL